MHGPGEVIAKDRKGGLIGVLNEDWFNGQPPSLVTGKNKMFNLQMSHAEKKKFHFGGFFWSSATTSQSVPLCIILRPTVA